METSVNNSKTRTGFFTSSEIVALTKSGKRDMTDDELAAHKLINPKSRKTTMETMFGEKAKTYIFETNIERKLDRSITADINAKPLNYGKLVEKYAFNQLGMEYKMASQDSIVHPTIPFWSGSADGFKFDEGKTVVDFKCPWTILSYCRFAECKTIEEVVENHPDGEKYKWQIISNAIINDCKYGELIFFCPYKNQLKDIRELAQDYPEQNKVAFVHFATDEELPYLNNGGYYKNFHTIRWEISPEEKSFLTERVLAAGALLEKRYESPEIKPTPFEDGSGLRAPK